jgi:Tfp pilus assembly protein PilP
LDGPGSFGELQDTVTLDCLKYVGSSIKQGVEYVQIQDELGKIHQLKVGSHMGEKTGMIVKIDSEAIYLRQMVKRGEDWEPLVVKFLKH